MNHYDDLQRFKDKTRNQKHNFKDLSAQNLASDQGSWTLIHQLSPATEESSLAMGGHVSLPIPQPIEPDLFALKEHEPAIGSEAVSAPTASILQDVASQLGAVAPVLNTRPNTSAPTRPTPVMTMSVPAAAPVNYAQLFAAKAPEAKPQVEKNQPLHSLLERIASCR